MPERHSVAEGQAVSDIRYSPDEFARIQRGFHPEVMEDKWFIYAEGESVFFHRSWTGHCIYQADFRPRDGAYGLERLAINRDPEQYTETDDGWDLRLFAYLVDVLLLGRNAEFPRRRDLRDDQAGLHRWSMMGRGG